MATPETPVLVGDAAAETVKLVTSAITLPVCALGVILSALSVATYRRIPLRNASSTFLTALAFADLVYLLLGLVRLAIYLTQATNQAAGRRARFYCLLVVIFVLISFRKFIVCMRCAISAERMLAVVFPLKSRRGFRLCRRPRLLGAAVLVLALLSNFPIMLRVDSEREQARGSLPTPAPSLNRSSASRRASGENATAAGELEEAGERWRAAHFPRRADAPRGWENLPPSGQPDREDVDAPEREWLSSSHMTGAPPPGNAETRPPGPAAGERARTQSGEESSDAGPDSPALHSELFQVLTLVAEICFMHVPFVLTVVFTLVLALAVRGSKEVRLRASNTASLARRRSQVTRMILFSTSAFIVLTLPLTLTMFLSGVIPGFLVTGSQRNLFLVVSRVSFACDVLDSTINFWFYFTMSKTFRMTFKMVMGKMTFLRCFTARRKYPLLYGSDTSTV